MPACVQPSGHLRPRIKIQKAMQYREDIHLSIPVVVVVGGGGAIVVVVVVVAVHCSKEGAVLGPPTA